MLKPIPLSSGQHPCIFLCHHCCWQSLELGMGSRAGSELPGAAALCAVEPAALWDLAWDLANLYPAEGIKDGWVSQRLGRAGVGSPGAQNLVSFSPTPDQLWTWGRASPAWASSALRVAEGELWQWKCPRPTGSQPAQGFSSSRHPPEVGAQNERPQLGGPEPRLGPAALASSLPGQDQDLVLWRSQATPALLVLEPLLFPSCQCPIHF